jgi:hypothetical protein
MRQIPWYARAMIRHAPFASLVVLTFFTVGCSSGPAPGPTTDSGSLALTDASSATTDSGPLALTDAYSATDPYSAARAACIAEINRLRATRSLPPYSAWTGVEACTDAQASSDQMNNAPHQAWGMHAGVCDGNGQNECLGQGADGIVACLDQMWAEREQPGCAGCDACADAYDPSCPNCDFYGTATGDVCGHYVNMSARFFDEAACGFGTGGWNVINFR